MHLVLHFAKFTGIDHEKNVNWVLNWGMASRDKWTNFFFHKKKKNRLDNYSIEWDWTALPVSTMQATQFLHIHFENNMAQITIYKSEKPEKEDDERKQEQQLFCASGNWIADIERVRTTCGGCCCCFCCCKSQLQKQSVRFIWHSVLFFISMAKIDRTFCVFFFFFCWRHLHRNDFGDGHVHNLHTHTRTHVHCFV